MTKLHSKQTGGRFSLVTQKRHILPPPLTAAHANVSEGTKVTFTSSEKEENERMRGGMEG